MTTQRRMLVADDNPERRLSIASLLARAGYNVESVADAELALSLARVRPPDLVVGAAALGVQVCTALRLDPVLGKIPVVVVLGTTDPTEREAALQAGADETQALPLPGEAFLDLLDQLLHIREVAAHLDVGAALMVEALNTNRR